MSKLDTTKARELLDADYPLLAQEIRDGKHNKPLPHIAREGY
jgi:hypothetical protein